MRRGGMEVGGVGRGWMADEQKIILGKIGKREFVIKYGCINKAKVPGEKEEE